MGRRVLLILPSATYRAHDFVEAARTLDAEVVVASDHRQTVGEGLVVDLCDAAAAADAIEALHASTPIDAIVAADDEGVLAAAVAARRLGMPHNGPEAVARTRDKAAMRDAFAAKGVPQPRYARAPGPVASVAETVGFPVVVKPPGLSASRGVIRADDAAQADAAAARIRAMLGDPAVPLLVESFVPGAEVAVEAILRGGRLDVLAIFDKPDPLDGPYFEETIYVTPSRLAAGVQARLHDLVASAAAALGLTEGAVHAEARVSADGTVTMLEVAARSIGGLCGRTLRFGIGMSLEEVILRHALGLPSGRLSRTTGASGVMMLPIPRAGVLEEVRGTVEASAVDGVAGVEITIPAGGDVVPLPEGDRYLGFVFARGDTPQQVEDALRTAHARLDIRIRG